MKTKRDESIDRIVDYIMKEGGEKRKTSWTETELNDTLVALQEVFEGMHEEFRDKRFPDVNSDIYKKITEKTRKKFGIGKGNK